MSPWFSPECLHAAESEPVPHWKPLAPVIREEAPPCLRSFRGPAYWFPAPIPLPPTGGSAAKSLQVAWVQFGRWPPTHDSWTAPVPHSGSEPELPPGYDSSRARARRCFEARHWCLRVHGSERKSQTARSRPMKAPPEGSHPRSTATEPTAAPHSKRGRPAGKSLPVPPRATYPRDRSRANRRND